MAASEDDESMPTGKIAAAVGGLAVFGLLLLCPAPPGLEDTAWKAVAVTLLMAIWWIGEALPLAATALLPIVLFPLLGVADAGTAAAPYAHPIVFMFLGGFLIGAAVERSGLHRRLSFAIIGMLGATPKRLVAGFLVAAAVSSMWISNTATAIMLLPVAQAVIARRALAGSGNEADKALLLAVAYGCSVGGVATLIGTPPNAMLAAFLDTAYGRPLGFAEWLVVGVPTMLTMLALAWLVLTRIAFRLEDAPASTATPETSLGPMGPAERRVALILAATAAAWISRPLMERWLPGLDDTIIALLAALALFLLPAGEGKRRLLSWSDAVRIRWGVLLLFGGGLSLAAAFVETGLAAAIGRALAEVLEDAPPILAIALPVVVMLLVTEVASNTAATAAMLPILAGLADRLGIEPMVILVPATLAASCAFMLPVATPPNAVVFGAGGLRIVEMAKAGAWMNAGAALILTAVGWLLA